MGKKISLQISGRRFEIDDVDENFADFLQQNMSKDFIVDGNNDTKSVLLAYVRKSYELYRQNKQIEKLIEKIEQES